MSRRGHKKHEEHHEGEAWLLPYSDLMTLLLAVFIVLFAVNSTSDPAKSEAMAQAFKDIIIPGGTSIIENGNNSVSPIEGGGLLIPPAQAESSQDVGDSNSLHRLKQIQGDLETYFQREHLEETVSTKMENGGLVITITDSPSGSIVFDSGSANIRPENEEILVRIGNTIANTNATIRVEGHTDNIPIRTAQYPSNWELSGARAASVVRIFAERCGIDPSRMATIGFGEFKPAEDNSTPEGRSANRRVEIIVSSSESATDPQTNFGLPTLEEAEAEEPIIEENLIEEDLE